MGEIEIGIVRNYFSKIGVGAIEIMDGELSIGDTVHIKGTTTDFVSTVESIQVEHQTVDNAKKGDLVGIKFSEKVREHDTLFKVTE